MNKKWVIVENAAMAFKAAIKQAGFICHCFGDPILPGCSKRRFIGKQENTMRDRC